MSATRTRISCLDGLRAVSICLVLLGHSLNTANFSGRWFQMTSPVLTNALGGVTVFFVISGYLITTLLQTESHRTGTISLSKFYAKRALRIFPAFYAYIIVIVLLTMCGWLVVAPVQIFCAATFQWNYRQLWNHVQDDGNWFLGHFWTLSLEEQFYLLWPPVLLFFRPAVARLALVLVVLSPVIRVVTYLIWPEVRPQIGLMLHTMLDPLMFGCLAALCQNGTRFAEVHRRMTNCGWLVPTGAACFLLLVSPYLRAIFHGGYQITVGTTLESFSIVVLMLWLIEHPDSKVGKLLQNRVVVHLGILSYSLYLWQQLFLTSSNTSWSGRFPVNLLVCLLVAEGSYQLIERPFLRLRRRVDPGLSRPSLP